MTMRHLTRDGKQVYETESLPGCNQIMVSFSVFTLPEHRGKGMGINHMMERLRHYKKLEYDVVICTVNVDNSVQRRILKQTGWEPAFVFNSTRTGNMIHLWYRHLVDV